MSWRVTCDLVIVGNGVAGLTAARCAREVGLRPLVLSKADPADTGTAWAQGGIAIAQRAEIGTGTDDVPEPDPPEDDVRQHAADTFAAGDGLCAPEAVRTILGAGDGVLRRLQRTGVRFDRTPRGTLTRTREGGHSTFRVPRCGGDATGAEVHRALDESARSAEVPVLTQHCATEIVRGTDGAVIGVLALDEHGRPGAVRAPAVLLATGWPGTAVRGDDKSGRCHRGRHRLGTAGRGVRGRSGVRAVPPHRVAHFRGCPGELGR